MSSRRKMSGSGTLQYVAKALAKCRCSPWVFFCRALEGLRGVDVPVEVDRFVTFEKTGPTGVPAGYEIPPQVLALADKVHRHPRPKDLIKLT